MSSLIDVKNLYRYYADHCAVRNLSFSLEPGEVLGLLGPNGAGKSTTLQMVAGNLAPSAGAICIDGIDLLDRARAAKKRLGYLPETPPLYPELTVNEYLCYCARLHHVRRSQVPKTVQQVQELCGVASVDQRLIGNLSKGFRQRVGIAQAILHGPRAVILDEPTVGLDPIQIREIRQLIRELGSKHGVILSTHLLAEVQVACTRVLIIQEGSAVFSERMEELSDKLQPSSLLVRFREPPQPSALERLPGVVQVETLDEHRMRIHIHNAVNPAEALTEASVNHGWGLQELTPERRSLEQIFVELTMGKLPPPPMSEA